VNNTRVYATSVGDPTIYVMAMSCPIGGIPLGFHCLTGRTMTIMTLLLIFVSPPWVVSQLAPSW
jgi:hypothetical protein